LVQALEQAREGFDEGLAEEQLHRKYQEAQKHYFGELEKLTKALVEEEKASPSAAPSGEEKPSEGETGGAGE
jgi:hypothetical protein